MLINSKEIEAKNSNVKPISQPLTAIVDNKNHRLRNTMSPTQFLHQQHDDRSSSSSSSIMATTPKTTTAINLDGTLGLAPLSKSSHQRCMSPRPGQKLRAKFPPHINISPPTNRSSSFDDELDNDVFRTPSPVRTPTSPSVVPEEKHEIHSGRLYLIRHTGSASSPSSAPSSPFRSPSKSPNVQYSSSPTSLSSPPSSPSSQNANNRRKITVFVRVYRCNLDHFVLISRDVTYTQKSMYVNMKHCRVLPGECLGRFILAGKCDSGTAMEFEVPELSSLELWLDALQVLTPPASPIRMPGGFGGYAGSSSSASTNSPPIPKSPALPTLTEIEEES